MRLIEAAGVFVALSGGRFRCLPRDVVPGPDRALEEQDCGQTSHCRVVLCMRVGEDYRLRSSAQGVTLLGEER